MYARYKPVNYPQAEVYQDNLWLGRRPGPDVGHRRHAPREMPFREWNPYLRVWHQGPHVLHNFRPKYYFTRPHDGKRGGWTGRLKDALTHEGADVFVTISGDKRTLMRDRPRRDQWTGWPLSREEMEDGEVYDKDWRFQDTEPVMETKFSRKKRWREPFYNFRNREFESYGRVMWHPKRVWRDAEWREGARRDDLRPWNIKDVNGIWWSKVPWQACRDPGGRPRR